MFSGIPDHVLNVQYTENMLIVNLTNTYLQNIYHSLILIRDQDWLQFPNKHSVVNMLCNVMCETALTQLNTYAYHTEGTILTHFLALA